MSNWDWNDFARRIGYNGCRNCKHQIEPLRTCEWDEKHREHNVVHIFCPGWEIKDEVGNEAE